MVCSMHACVWVAVGVCDRNYIAVWAENLAGIKFGGLALKGCELHLAD